MRREREAQNISMDWKKSRQKIKTINILKCEDGSITRNQKRILDEQFRFYQNLYTSDSKIEFTFTDPKGEIFSEQQKIEIDQPFTFQEYTEAMKSMASNKAPGIDGLSVEFYKLF